VADSEVRRILKATFPFSSLEEEDRLELALQLTPVVANASEDLLADYREPTSDGFFYARDTFIVVAGGAVALSVLSVARPEHGPVPFTYHGPRSLVGPLWTEVGAPLPPVRMETLTASNLLLCPLDLLQKFLEQRPFVDGLLHLGRLEAEEHAFNWWWMHHGEIRTRVAGALLQAASATIPPQEHHESFVSRLGELSVAVSLPGLTGNRLQTLVDYAETMVQRTVREYRRAGHVTMEGNAMRLVTPHLLYAEHVVGRGRHAYLRSHDPRLGNDTRNQPEE
jgi:hypothetical protein